MKPAGLLLIAAALLLPIIWLVGIAPQRDIIALLSQYVGMMALIAMAFSQIIATRWAGIESVFGPLDQSYRIHKWLGIGAMVGLMMHDVVDAEMRGLGRETLLAETAETFGEISLYGLLIAVVITVATFIPYHLWKWTHRLIGIFFIMGAFHYLFIQKPFSNLDPIGLYMIVILAIGTIAYLYTSAPRGMRPSSRYRIQAIEAEGEALAISMTPVKKGIEHRAGQFAFFAFEGAGHNEPHPFTISTAPRADKGLRVTIAPLGDFTIKVRQAVETGQSVRVDGPYGHFGRVQKGPQVWVAGGVGVTPFVAMAAALNADSDPVTMFYAVRHKGAAAHIEELQTLADQKANFSLVLWESDVSGRLTPDRLIEAYGGDLRRASVSFCGPSGMRKALVEGLLKHGVSRPKIHFEAFEIRTGVGLEQLAGWLWQKAWAQSKKRTSAKAA